MQGLKRLHWRRSTRCEAHAAAGRLGHHPRQRDVGQTVFFIGAAHIAVVAPKPALIERAMAPLFGIKTGRGVVSRRVFMPDLVQRQRVPHMDKTLLGNGRVVGDFQAFAKQIKSDTFDRVPDADKMQQWPATQ